MRLLAVAHDLERHGGQEQSLLEVLQHLHRRGHEIDLLYRRDGSLSEDYRAASKRTQCVPAYRPESRRPIASTSGTVWALLAGARSSPELVYLNQARDDLPFGVVMARAHRIPLVCHLRIEPPRRRRIWRRFIPGVAHFIAVSHSVRADYAAAGVDPERITVIPNGVDLTRFAEGRADDVRAGLGISGEDVVVLYAGRLSPTKGIEVALEAFGAFAEHWPLGDSHLLVAGVVRNQPPHLSPEAYEQRLRERSPPRTHWLGLRSDMPALMRAADVVVIPTVDNESCPRAGLEALASGRPVIGSRVGGIPEVLGSELEKFLVPPGDPAALAAALSALVGARAEWPMLRRLCRTRAERHFPLSATLTAVENVLTSVARSGRRGVGGQRVK